MFVQRSKKDPPEKNCVCEFSTKPCSPLTQLQTVLPVCIQPWLTAIAMGPAKQAQSLPAYLLVEEVFFLPGKFICQGDLRSLRQALLQIKKATSARLWNPAWRPTGLLGGGTGCHQTKPFLPALQGFLCSTVFVDRHCTFCSPFI